MGQEVEQFEIVAETAESRIEIEKAFFLEDRFTSGNLVQAEFEVVAETTEVFRIGREFRLTACVQRRDVGDAEMFLIFTIAGFNARTGTQKHHLPGIWGKSRELPVYCVMTKAKTQRVSQ